MSRLVTTSFRGFEQEAKGRHDDERWQLVRGLSFLPAVKRR